MVVQGLEEEVGIAQDVRDGKVKQMADRDQTKNKTAESAQGFTDVSDDTETPWG